MRLKRFACRGVWKVQQRTAGARKISWQVFVENGPAINLRKL